MEREPETDIITYSQFLEALRIVKKYGKQIELHNEEYVPITMRHRDS